MLHTSNPAARLHLILRRLKEGEQTRQLQVAWREVLDLPEGDHAQLLVAVSELVQLPSHAERAIESLPEDGAREEQLLWREPVRAAMSLAHQFETAAANVAARYSAEALLSLRMAAARIDHERPPTVLEEDSAAEALRLVSELLDVLATADDLEPEVRALLLRHAARLHMALRLAALTGADGIRDALVDAYGAVSAATGGRANYDKRAGVRKFLEVLTYTAAGLSIPAESSQLIVGVHQILQLTGHA